MHQKIASLAATNPMTPGIPNNLGGKGPINALCCLKDFKRLNQRMTLPDPLTQ
jgi:hypothetical protein